MEEDLKKAIVLLESNGYFVIKKTKAMEEAMENCSDDNCLGCACSICLMID